MPQILSCVSDLVFLSVGCDRNHPPTGSKTEDAGLPWDNCEKNSRPKEPQIYATSGVALLKDPGSASGQSLGEQFGCKNWGILNAMNSTSLVPVLPQQG
jgi:hypothetical protein